jgi:PAS domain S-box-containing protein
MSKDELLKELHRKDAHSAKAVRKVEELYRSLFTSMTIGYAQCEIICDSSGTPCDFRFLETNDSFKEETGFAGAEVKGRTANELFPGIESAWIEHFAQVSRTGESTRFEQYNHNTDRHYDVLAFTPARGKFSFLFMNVTKRKEAEAVMARYRLISQYAHDPILLMTLDGRLIEANQAAVELYGYSCEELLSLNIKDLCPTHDGKAMLGAMEQARSRGIVFESEHLRKDGARVPVEVSSRGIVLDGEQMLLSVVRDVTERKQMQDALLKNQNDLKLANELLEQRVIERTADLEAAIREQESFSYSVSHDLRAPLRHINSFSSILIEEHGGELSPKARDYLDRICAASSRMGALIDHLLKLSRVTRAEIKLGTVNLSELAGSALRMFQETEPKRRAECVIERNIKVLGDQALLLQLLENLLGNAWKYTSKKAEARIEFGRCLVCGEEAFFVRDNGAGFDMAYRKKLFETFGRLHGAEFEGIGIGLATAQRIIQRHGGKIWAEGVVDRGATFYFTLPVYF